MKRNNKELLIILLLLILTLAGFYLYRPFKLEEISTVAGFVRYAESFGAVMPVSAFLITVIQAVVPAVPFLIISSANGVLFGFFKGVIITWVGTLAGASLTFLASRRLGYEGVRYKNKGNILRYIEKMKGTRGFWVILALRLLPYFPAPLVNIAAGASRINYLWFLLASALGKLPFIIGYTILGYSLVHSKNYMLGLVVVTLLVIGPYLIVKKTRGRVSFQGKQH